MLNTAALVDEALREDACESETCDALPPDGFEPEEPDEPDAEACVETRAAATATSTVEETPSGESTLVSDTRTLTTSTCCAGVGASSGVPKGDERVVVVPVNPGTGWIAPERSACACAAAGDGGCDCDCEEVPVWASDDETSASCDEVGGAAADLAEPPDEAGCVEPDERGSCPLDSGSDTLARPCDGGGGINTALLVGPSAGCFCCWCSGCFADDSGVSATSSIAVDGSGALSLGLLLFFALAELDGAGAGGEDEAIAPIVLRRPSRSRRFCWLRAAACEMIELR